MRTLLAASAVLVIMTVLLFEPAEPLPQRGAPTLPREEPAQLGPQRAGGPQRAPQRAASVSSVAVSGTNGERGASTPEPVSGSTTAGQGSGAAAPTTRTHYATAVAGVERFKRGSREHAAAVGKALASPDHKRIVAPVARLYLAYFNRVPDYEGFAHYLGEREVGVPLADIAQEFAGSAEFAMRYGDLDNAAFVDRVHRNVGTAAAHRDYWIAQLDSGAMTRGQVMLQFSESDGFRAATQNEVFIAMAYAEVQRRAPTPAERAHWEAFLVAGHPHGAMLEALVAGGAQE